MVKSKLATKVVDFGVNKSNPRNTKIIGITPHHMAGVSLADDCARGHLYSNRQASANYYIGYDGTICAGVSEDRRAWTSSSRPNDHSHITIEVSNSKCGSDWPISDAAYKALVNLCADICKRYDITPHFSGGKDGTITYHQMFEKTDCPGPYLKRIIDSGKFEKDIIEAMGEEITPPSPTKTLYRVQAGAFKNVNGARDLEARLKDDEFDAYVVKVGDLYKVQCGAFKTKSYAEKLVKELADAEYEAFITTNLAMTVKPGEPKIDPVEKLGYWVDNEYRVVVKLLNVRSGAGLNYSILDRVRLGDSIKILDAKMVGSEVWVKIDKGWVCGTSGDNVYIR
jgi:hypothetical protein